MTFRSFPSGSGGRTRGRALRIFCSAALHIGVAVLRQAVRDVSAATGSILAVVRPPSRAYCSADGGRMPYEHILLTRDGHVARLELTRPEARNAMSVAMGEE